MWPRIYLIESKINQFKLIKAELNGQTTDIEEVEILAYTGGPVDLGLPYPIIFDLSSTVPASTVPLLADHDPTQIAGHSTKVDISSTDIKVKGLLSGTGDKANEIRNNFKNGYPWQASVGIVSDQLDFIPDGKTETINGQKAVGPVYVARKNVLREVSFVGLGADPNTLSKLVASLYQGLKMPTFEDWVKSLGFDPTTLTPEQTAALQTVYDELNSYSQQNNNQPPPADQQTAANARAKRLVAALAKRSAGTGGGNNGGTGGNAGNTGTGNNTGSNTGNNDGGHTDPNYITNIVRNTFTAEMVRVDRIKSFQAQYNDPKDKQGNSIALTAIKEGWTLEKAELEIMKAARPNVHVGGGNSDDRNGSFVLLAAAVCQTGKMSEKLLKRQFSDQILEASHKKYKSRVSLQQLILEAAYIGGYTGNISSFRTNLKEILRAAFSTMDLPNILAQITNAFLLEGYSYVDDSWRKIAKITTATDFKTIHSYRMTGGFTFEKIAKDGMIPHGQISELAYTNKIDTYAKMFGVTRQDMYNDYLGAFTDLPKAIGRGGALGLVRGFWTEFLNNSTFFAAGNNNVSTGALGIPGLDAANLAFKKLKDPQGEYISGEPVYLVVPPELEPLALQLYRDTNLLNSSTATGGSPATNRYQGKYEPISSPYLSDSSFTGYSTTAYYLLADPNDVPTIEVAFLDGNETPIVETADADFNQLGIQMRGYFDWGVKKQDPNGGVRSTGV